MSTLLSALRHLARYSRRVDLPRMKSSCDVIDGKTRITAFIECAVEIDGVVRQSEIDAMVPRLEAGYQVLEIDAPLPVPLVDDPHRSVRRMVADIVGCELSDITLWKVPVAASRATRYCLAVSIDGNEWQEQKEMPHTFHDEEALLPSLIYTDLAHRIAKKRKATMPTAPRPCDDCDTHSADLIEKGDHHGGTKTVCRDRDACHRREAALAAAEQRGYERGKREAMVPAAGVEHGLRRAFGSAIRCAESDSKPSPERTQMASLGAPFGRDGKDVQDREHGCREAAETAQMVAPDPFASQKRWICAHLGVAGPVRIWRTTGEGALVHVEVDGIRGTHTQVVDDDVNEAIYQIACRLKGTGTKTPVIVGDYFNGDPREQSGRVARAAREARADLPEGVTIKPPDAPGDVASAPRVETTRTTLNDLMHGSAIRPLLLPYMADETDIDEWVEEATATNPPPRHNTTLHIGDESIAVTVEAGTYYLADLVSTVRKQAHNPEAWAKELRAKLAASEVLHGPRVYCENEED